MLYNQRSIYETVNSVIKRSNDSAVRAWYRQFREITLAAAVYNVEQAVKQWIPLPSADSVEPIQTYRAESFVLGTADVVSLSSSTPQLPLSGIIIFCVRA